MFNINISVKDNKILGEFIAESYFFEPTKYEYVIYLCRDNEKIKKQSFSKKMNAIFDLGNMSGEFYIRVLIRDIIHRDIRAYNSKKLMINN